MCVCTYMWSIHVYCVWDVCRCPHNPQVEAALTNDPGNEELLKLKKDLEDVISITGDLLEMAAPQEKSIKQQGEQAEPKSTKQWKVGDLCTAVWSGDGRWASFEGVPCMWGNTGWVLLENCVCSQCCCLPSAWVCEWSYITDFPQLMISVTIHLHTGVQALIQGSFSPISISLKLCS